jgi:hypothetical protein
VNGSGDNGGIAFPYYDPLTGVRHTCRLRRDHPDFENGVEKKKYLAAFGDRRHLYMVRGCAEQVLDITVPVVLVEAEKSALALTAWSERTGHRILPVAMGGCWGWRGIIGKKEGPHGQRVDEKGALPELATLCSGGRKAYIMLDSNADSNRKVRAARSALTQVLLGYGAEVRIVSLPIIAGTNGPDDFVASAGDDALWLVIESAHLPSAVAICDAEAAITEVESNEHDTDLLRNALDAIAGVGDKLNRESLEARLAAMVRGTISKRTIIEEVREERHRREQETEESRRKVEEAELLRRPVNAANLIIDLEKFFTERVYLPMGAALLLAYFVLNTYVFELFDTAPYLSIESATPGRGKSTLLDLLKALCRSARKATSLSEAALFRIIDAEKPTLLIDEAKALEGRSERAEAIRAVAHEGYKVGGQVPRCEGDEHDIRWFDVYCPKAIAEIGGLSGALLDRCVVIHMEKAPRNHVRRSTRVRALKRDSHPLVEQLKAYALQSMVQLGQLYAEEPDQGYWPTVKDREAELYGPLLIHAKLIGAEAEQRLLAVVENFTAAKSKIKAEDWEIAKAVAMLEVLEGLEGDTTFTPGDLVDGLAEYEVWSLAFGKVKGADEKTRHKGMAAKIGYFLKSFRLQGDGSSGVKKYDLRAAIDVIRAHVPENHQNHQNHQKAEASEPKAVENTIASDSSDSSDALAGSSPDIGLAPENYRPNKDDGFFSGVIE